MQNFFKTFDGAKWGFANGSRTGPVGRGLPYPQNRGLAASNAVKMEEFAE